MGGGLAAEAEVEAVDVGGVARVAFVGGEVEGDGAEVREGADRGQGFCGVAEAAADEGELEGEAGGVEGEAAVVEIAGDVPVG